MLTKIRNICQEDLDEAFTSHRMCENGGPIKVYYGDQRKFEEKLEPFYIYLSQEEKERSKRFIHKRDERTYVIAHSLLNREISTLLKKDFQELSICYFENRKPFVEGILMDFNLSHSGDYFAFSVGSVGALRIGVDIEVVSEAKDMESIVNTYFHVNEKNYILRADLIKSKQFLRFYEIWTRKEALLKMLGIGISEVINTIDLTPGERDLKILEAKSMNSTDFSDAFVNTVCIAGDRMLTLSTNKSRAFQLLECTSLKKKLGYNIEGF